MRPQLDFQARVRVAMEEAAPPPYPVNSHSAWHSPVPYLFGGLAAMLGLIAFALLILACSYWKLSSFLDSGDAADQPRDGNAGEKPGSSVKTSPYQDGIVVIMAGEDKPTFIATPIGSSADAFAGTANTSTSPLSTAP